MYVALSAKFMGESSEGVGEKTFISVVEHDCAPRYLDERYIDAYREHWFKDLAPKLPNPESAALEQAVPPRKIMVTPSASSTSASQQ
jgi:hypothetical protein